jgi:hypothetical protein
MFIPTDNRYIISAVEKASLNKLKKPNITTLPYDQV